MNLTEPKTTVGEIGFEGVKIIGTNGTCDGWVRKVGVWRHPDGSMITRHWQKAYLNAKQEFVTVREAFECWKTTSQSANV